MEGASPAFLNRYPLGQLGPLLVDLLHLDPRRAGSGLVESDLNRRVYPGGLAHLFDKEVGQDGAGLLIERILPEHRGPPRMGEDLEISVLVRFLGFRNPPNLNQHLPVERGGEHYLTAPADPTGFRIPPHLDMSLEGCENLISPLGIQGEEEGGGADQTRKVSGPVGIFGLDKEDLNGGVERFSGIHTGLMGSGSVLDLNLDPELAQKSFKLGHAGKAFLFLF